MSELSGREAERAWTVASARDVGQDGRFVFAVTTTGIYCRPSCPARRPRRDHVRFFALPASAEAAGFRACRRCHPASTPPGVERVESARRHIDANPDDTLSLVALARVVGGSPHHLQRAFKARYGVSPREYAAARKLGTLRGALRKGSDVTTATYEAGYASSSRMYEHARKGLGMNPSTYRAGGRGETIRYATRSTRLGRLLLAATRHGVCAVRFGRSVSELRGELASEFPDARLQPDAAGLDGWLATTVALLEGDPAHIAAGARLPLDLRASVFQQRVFDALRRIPRGQTRSYADVARDLGEPGAARAVGGACASNPVALLVPCHRVVRADGAAGGYRWGVARKERLLKAEAE